MTVIAGLPRPLLRGALPAAAVLLLASCITGGGPAVAGAGSSPNVEFSGAPELAGTATLPANPSRPPAALAAAAVLGALSWPVVSVDSVRGSLVSDWQYFEPAIRGSARQGFCDNPMALRFTVHDTGKGWTQLTAEAYVPRAGGGWSASPAPTREEIDHRNALGQARSALGRLRIAIAAALINSPTTMRAVTDLGRELEEGSYRRCLAS